jgi:hypothetical protein
MVIPFEGAGSVTRKMQLPCHIFCTNLRQRRTAAARPRHHRISTHTGAAMNPDKLMIPLAQVLSQHREQILPMLGGQAGGNARALLGNDAAMRTLATYSYALLPGLVRLAVKEPVFLDFVMNNRDKILERLLVQ